MRTHRFHLACLIGQILSVAALAQQPKQKEPTGEQKALLQEAQKWAEETTKLRKEGKIEEAIRAAEKLLAAEIKLYGELHEDAIGSLDQIAECREQLEQFDEAKKVREQILGLQSKRFGKDDYRVTDAGLGLKHLELLKTLRREERQQVTRATQLNQQGVSLYQTSPKEALLLLQEALDIRKRVLGENHPDYAMSLNNLANLYHGIGQLAKAEPLYLQAKEIRKRVLGENHPDYARSLNNLAELYRDLGQPAKAEPLYLQAKEIWKKVLGENHPDYARSLNNLAELYRGMGQPAKAEPLYLQAKEIWKKVLGENHPDYAMSLNNLANLYHGIGQLAKAEPLYLQAKEIRKRVLGENHPDYARSLNNLAELYRDLDQPAKAEPLYLQAAEIVKKVRGDNHPDYAASLNNLAGSYRGMGQPAKAEPLYLQAKEIWKKVLGENHPDYAMSLNNLAELYRDLGQPAKAEPLYLQAKEIWKKVLGENHPLYTASLNNLAEYYCDLDQPAKAEPLFLQAAEIVKKVRGDNHPDYAASLNNLAGSYRGMGQPARAEPLFLQALGITKKVLGENHPLYAATLNNLAELYRDLGQPSKAEPLYLQAVAIVTANLERNSAIQTEAGQLENAQSKRFYWENLLQGTAKTNSISAYEPLFRIRGAVTIRQIFSRAIRHSKPDTKPLVEELQNVCRQMNRLVNSPPDPNLTIDVPQKLHELNQQYEKLQRDLAAKSNAIAEHLKRKKATSADLKKLLPENAVLVDYLSYKDQLCAFVITKNKISRFELGEMKPITEAIDRFRDELLNPDSPRNLPLTDKKDDPASLLREKLWQPLRESLGSAKTVLICPDGDLCRLPFSALPGKDDQKYLIEEVAVAVIPVPQMLFDILAPRPEKKEALGLLTMGDVDFANVEVVTKAEPTFKLRRTGEAMSWPGLPGTREEIVTIADSFKQAVPSGKQLSLRGKEATEDRLRQHLGQFEFVHLATHGFFAPQGLTAYAKNKGAELRTSLDDRPKVRGPNPGLMSGIVCAGANKPDCEGVLTALDIAELDLTRVELVVLSACDTGLGESARGEGVFGLQRAFHLAGARTTVTSLWKVKDQATRDLMMRFYENYFKKNLGTLESLCEAQLSMLKDGPSRGFTLEGEPIKESKKEKPKGRTPPVYWAAFSLAGDWR